MENKIAQIKEHIKEHKQLYIGIGIGAGLAGISWAIMRGTTARGGVGADAAQRGTINTASSNAIPNAGNIRANAIPNAGNIGFDFSNSVFNGNVKNVVSVKERTGRGHPGYIVRCIEDNLGFESQNDAARAYNVHPTTMSDHLNGRADNVAGKHFERVNLVEAKSAA